MSAGSKFVGGASIIAGVVPQLAPIKQLRSRHWDCREALVAQDPVDRYAAAKAMPYVSGGRSWGIQALSRALEEETDDRISLEIIASSVRLNPSIGVDGISSVIWNHERNDLRMEGVLILTELGTAQASNELTRVAKSNNFSGDEIRQAAVWGLGKTGTRAYRDLVEFIADEDDGVALHAIGAFGPDTPSDVIDNLVSLLGNGNPRARAAASEALRVIGSANAMSAVIRAAKQSSGDQTWLLATLGRFPANRVREELAGESLLMRVAPMLALGPDDNWLARPLLANDLDFLLIQNL
jgi:HEAT repeat protein